MGDAAADAAAAAAAAAQQQQGAAPEWHTHLTDDLKADPVVSNWVKSASEKDVPSIIKGLAHMTSRMGSAINLDKLKPEDMPGLREKIYKAGVFTAPPAKPEDYGIVKPEKLPDGIGWNDEFGKKVSTTLHKHGIPKEAVPELMALYEEGLLGTQKAFQTSVETGTAALKKEFGDRYDELKELAGRILPAIFKTPEELALAEELGLANHPGFMGPIMRLAPLAAQDSSFMSSLQNGGTQDGTAGEDVRSELAKIMTDKSHPMHEGYWKNPQDPAVTKHIDDLYKKAHPGTGQMQESFSSAR